jgi:hypothetical protein
MCRTCIRIIHWMENGGMLYFLSLSLWK